MSEGTFRRSNPDFSASRFEVDGKAVAIVGLGCRFAGNVTDPETFWKLIQEGTVGIVDVPADRWDASRFYDSDKTKAGKTYMRKGGFMQHPIFDFDALFFGISPREAEPLDPQQRLLLEVTWEALEDAGLSPQALAGSQTGVFMGGFIGDNQLTQMTTQNRDEFTSHTAVSATLTMLSNRISYSFNFLGPSLSIDTACSSSLVALHYAHKALVNGECTLAVAGGVNVMFRPETMMSLCKGQFLSEDGHSKSFDARADGYGRGEGAGIVILKPLQAALADGDRIYAVIRGSGVNQDGRTDGITVPNPAAQEALMRRVCAESGIEPQRMSYVEAHGTGTAVGDPLEASAIGSFYGRCRSADTPLPIGSVKANIGHTEAAAGVAGTIKSALCLLNSKIPPLANLQEPNPAIPFDDLNLKLPRSVEAFPATDGPLFAAINSFGYGGTNAHLILQSPPPVANDAPVSATTDVKPYLLPLSARSLPALRALAMAYQARLRAIDDDTFRDVAYCASVKRAHLGHRLAIVAENPAEAIAQLQAYLDGESGSHYATGNADGELSRKPVFVFTGMGPQWWAMGQELLRDEPVFLQMAKECDEVFTALAGWSILEEMSRAESDSRMHETQIAQPANFVIQAALTALWRSWGIEPAAIVGHSVGEVTAAYVSGMLSLEDSIKVSYHRSRIQKKAAGTGKMLAVSTTPGAANALLERYAGQVSIAAINGPTTLTLAGDSAAIDELAAYFEGQGVFNRLLRVEVPYHSPRMDPLLPEVREVLCGITPRMPTIPLYSTVTGQRVTSASYDAEYWCQNIRQPVQFASAIATLYTEGHSLYLEVGPNPVLASSIKEIAFAQGGSTTVLASLRRGQPEVPTLHKALGQLYCHGAEIEWSTRFRVPGRFVDLPKYPWQRERYWHEPAAIHNDRLGNVDHPLLGLALRLPVPTWEQRLGGESTSYFAQHVVDGVTVVPGAAYVELGLAAHNRLVGSSRIALTNVNFNQALVLDRGQDRVLQTSYQAKTHKLCVYSQPVAGDNAWLAHAEMILSAVEPGPAGAVDLVSVKARCTAALPVDEVYAELEQRGLHYGTAFRCMRIITRGDKEALVRIALADETERTAYLLHPTLLDAAFQSMIALIDPQSDDTRIFVPVAMDQIVLHREIPSTVWAWTRLVGQTASQLRGHITLCDEQGEVLAELRQVVCQALPSAAGKTDEANWVQRVQWFPTETVTPASNSATAERWLVFANGTDRLSVELGATAEGEVVRLVRPEHANPGAANQRVVADTSSAGLLALFKDYPDATRIVYSWGMDLSLTGTVTAPAGALALCQRVIAAAAAAYVETPPRIYVVTCDASAVEMSAAEKVSGLAQAPLVGLALVAASELPQLRVTTIDIDGSEEQDAIPQLIAELRADQDEDCVAIRHGQRFVQRVTRMNANVGNPADESDAEITLSPDRACRLELGTPGKLASLHYREFERFPPGAGEVEVAVKAVALNFKDVAKAMGMLEDAVVSGTYFGEHLGMEASGTVVRVGPGVSRVKVGDDLIFTEPDCFRSYVTLNIDKTPNRVIAAGFSTTEAAAVPVVFITVHYALRYVAHLAKGETILVHAAAGGVGLAAIQLAQAVGASVIATVSSEEKAEYVRSLGVEHVFHSRTLDFVEQIRQVTEGRGVDVVLNSLGGEFIAESMKVLAPFGRFIELGKRDIVENNTLPLLPFNENLTFASVDFDRLVATRHAYAEELLDEVQACFVAGVYKPLPTKVFTAENVVDAFTLMARAQHIGKVVVNMDAEQGIKALPMRQEKPLFTPDATYLVTGGLGGFGLATAQWLVKHGVKHLALAGRSGAASEVARATVQALTELGAEVSVHALDISDQKAVHGLLTTLHTPKRPLKGVFHAAGVLDDAPLVELDEQRFARVYAPKALGAWHLHLATQDLALDHFVLFSSVAALIGNARQANYVAANVFLDSLAHYRRARGLAAVSVNWGAIAGAGMAADEQVKAYLELLGLAAISPVSALDLFAGHAYDPIAQFAVVNLDWQRWSVAEPVTSSKPRFAEMIKQSDDAANAHAAFCAALVDLSQSERCEFVSLALADQVAHTLKLPVERLDLHKSLTDLGMDSLMAVELQSTLKLQLGVELSTLELLKGATIAQLAERILQGLDLTAAAPKAGHNDAVSELPELVDTMSDQQLDQLLAGLAN